MKNSIDHIGNQTHGLPACSAVPQLTAPPRAPVIVVNMIYFLQIWRLAMGVPHQ